jgi:hypothetical protein
MSLNADQFKFTHDVAKLIVYIYSKGYKCTFGETFRTAEQAAINEKKGIGIAKSNHCKRLAIDLNLFSISGKYLSETIDYEIFGKYWESLDQSNRWGGHFPRADGNHFEAKED